MKYFWVDKQRNNYELLQVTRALHEMMYAESGTSCEVVMQRFTQEYKAKYPKAVKTLGTEMPRLLTHFDFPAVHWKHIRSTNPIESIFATVTRWTRVDQGSRLTGG